MAGNPKKLVASLALARQRHRRANQRLTRLPSQWRGIDGLRAEHVEFEVVGTDRSTHRIGVVVIGMRRVDASKQPAALPLPRHQAYGTVLVKVKRAVDAHNPKTGEATRALRSAIERVDGPVLELARTDALFPPDERL